MKKNLLFILLFIFSGYKIANAQISGSTTVCAGYTYSYTTSIAGAASYNWTVPSGWYDMTGQGTSQLTVTCNELDGIISVQALDGSGNVVGVENLTVQFSGGSGWSLNPSSVYSCAGQPAFSNPIYVLPNGSGGGPGCPSGCGTGIQNADIDFVIYDSLWPGGNFVGFCNGQYTMPYQNSTYYVYQVDHTAGLVGGTQAILISGGCGSASVNNTVDVYPLFPVPVILNQDPMPVCLGDTFTVTAFSMTNFYWNTTPGLHFGITAVDSINNPAMFIANSTNAMVDIIGIDMNGCFNDGNTFISVSNCNPTGIAETNKLAEIADATFKNGLLLLHNYTHKEMTFKVYTLKGELLTTKTTSNDVLEIPMPDLPVGSYIIQALSDDGNLTLKRPMLSNGQ